MDDTDFDVLAASLRADTGDLRVFVEALATKLEGAFGSQVRVERKGGMLGPKHVRRIALDLGDDRYQLEHDDGRIECRRSTVVRGIALKNEELQLDAWIDDVSRRLVEAARSTEHGRAALERLLSE